MEPTDHHTCEIPYLPIYLDTKGERFMVVDRDLYSKIIHPTWGKWYLHKARKCWYARSWMSGHVRTYVQTLVQKLLKRRRPSDQHVVRHLNGNTMDNRGRNLKWGTKKTNQKCADYVEV